MPSLSAQHPPVIAVPCECLCRIGTRGLPAPRPELLSALPRLSFTLTAPLAALRPPYTFKFLESFCVRFLRIHLRAGAPLRAFPGCFGLSRPAPCATKCSNGIKSADGPASARAINRLSRDRLTVLAGCRHGWGGKRGHWGLILEIQDRGTFCILHTKWAYLCIECWLREPCRVLPG